MANIIQVAAGSDFSLALDSSGNVYSWGKNNFGQLGIGTTMDTNSPVMINALSDIIEIVAGSEHVLALDSNGDVWAFGNNTAFQSSGNASVSKDSVPVVTTCGKVRIGAGNSFSYAVDSTGAAFSWGGNNTSGQLGDGSSGLYNAYPPTSVSIVSGKVNQIGSGPFYAYALTNDGVAHSWGGNSAGLGDGSSTSSPTSTVTVASACDIKNWDNVINNVSCGGGSNVLTAYNGVPHPVPGLVEAEEYGEGGAGVAYSDVDGNIGTTDPRNDDVDMETCSDAGGGVNVGWIEDGEWLKYVVDVTETGFGSIDFRIASESAGGSMRITFDNQGIDDTVGFAGTGGWQTWATQTIGNLDFTVLGPDTMSVYMTSGGFNFNYVEVDITADSVIDNITDATTNMDNVYPNPFDNVLNIKVKENATINIINSIGQKVLSLDVVKGINTIQSNKLETLNKGLYFVSIIGKNNSRTYSVIKK